MILDRLVFEIYNIITIWMLFTDESCNSYNYFSFSAQLFILPGINNCLTVFIYLVFYVKVKIPHSCPTLCNPMDCRVHGNLQARILEWVAFPFSRGSSQPRDQTQVSHIVGGFFTRWAIREALKPIFDSCLTLISRHSHMGYSVNHTFLDVFWRFLICSNMSVPGTLSVLLVSPFTGWWFLLLPVKMSLFLLYIQLIFWMGIKFKTGNHSP